ncbi:MAG: FAD-dependent oxidoreductase [Actinomycetia bacterium]|nr:FAD-dependent oxidoreductase [Actinomycetes bacterium]
MSAVQAMRAAGHDGHIIVADRSPVLPKDRPPLSKQVLAGEWDLGRANQPVASQLAELDVDLRLDCLAQSLDAANRLVVLADGEHIEAEGIVVATGSAARQLPGPQLEGVHTLRTGADSMALRDRLDATEGRVVVVGAGFIGAEVAATCRELGRDVTMIEAAPVPLQRALPGDIGMFVADLHRDHGVDVRLGVGIESIESDDDGAVKAVLLADGTELEASVVVVGIGAAVQTGWLEGSGLDVRSPADGGGVLCDATMLAAPGIVAAGDVAAWPNPHFGGEVMRVEHWENAIDQGTHAGRRLTAELGGGASGPIDPFASVPWFWTDQYDAKIQMVGRASPEDEVVVVDGSPAERRFVALFRRGDQCRAALGVNRARLVVQARMKLAESLDWYSVMELFS